MKLKKIDYSEFLGTEDEWILKDFTLSDINLIVSTNAIRKTRTISVIHSLATLLDGERRILFMSGKYSAEFDLDGRTAVYSIEFKDQKVVNKKYLIDNEILLDRDSTGEGNIQFKELGKNIRFQTSTDEVAAYARRDKIQHDFLDELYKWAASLFRYNFGTNLGQSFLIIPGSPGLESTSNLNNKAIKESEKVVEIFKLGIHDIGEKFTNSIINDMSLIGYKLDKIGLGPLRNLILTGNIPVPFGIYVKERDRLGNTDQPQMSQGMFRSLSILIQINYAILSAHPSCILIDDIGEGLDFERSSSLIKLLMEKARENSIQLILATNDRFVMNNVPLEYWIILQRMGGKVFSFNYRNAKATFDEFEYTGLNNFDLFSGKYYLKDNKKL